MKKVTVHEGLGVKQSNGLNVAFKFDGGKPRMDLVDPVFLEDLANVLTFGSDKYDESQRVFLNNWRQGGMRWGQVFASSMRHAWAWWRGEDVDPDSGMLHLSHLAANIMFLHYYSRRCLHLDDRDHVWRRPIKIALDIDGVLADWSKAVYEACLSFDPEWECDTSSPIWWNWIDRPFLNKVLDSIDYPAFMATAPECMIDPKALTFEPVAYITHRTFPSQYTEEWIKKVGLPLAPVITVDDPLKKIQVLKDMQINVFVEDKFETFVECNNAGVLCFLMDRPMNRRHDVGNYRIKNLNEITERMK